jgi:peptide/nickel transport system ATP-binding protein/oligopeptide transport system ATP-binding protein
MSISINGAKPQGTDRTEGEEPMARVDAAPTQTARPRAGANALEVADLTTVFHTRDGVMHAVNGVSFTLAAGELLAVVGESGSGKSVAMMSLLQLLPSPPADITRGRVVFDGVDLTRLSPSRIRAIRGRRIGFVFQDPMTSLNPVFSVGYQIMEPLREHLGMNRKQARRRAIELLELVGIPSATRRVDDYPHQFSGGMRQRVVIAMALACDPEVLIADEPTTALDVTVQAQILELVRDLRRKLGMAVIWITHDLGVAAGISDRVLVMYGGQVVELAPVGALFDRPRHPYTRALLDSLPARHAANERLRTIEGSPAVLREAPASCSFAPRCAFAFERCRRQNPPLIAVGDGHEAACWLAADRGGERATA